MARPRNDSQRPWLREAGDRPSVLFQRVEPWVDVRARASSAGPLHPYSWKSCSATYGSPILRRSRKDHRSGVRLADQRRKCGRHRGVATGTPRQVPGPERRDSSRDGQTLNVSGTTPNLTPGRSAISRMRFHSASDTGITDNREILTSGRILEGRIGLYLRQPHWARQLLHRCDVDDGLFSRTLSLGSAYALPSAVVADSHDRLLVPLVMIVRRSDRPSSPDPEMFLGQRILHAAPDSLLVFDELRRSRSASVLL